ncbi:hypothetical protein GF402_01330 [Candidatus Fermentibacteria bacterium]|nr:hypothetical protein [Candidatus Fermentibacteria bacterium]
MRTLYWAPRILGIAFAVFISLFALDVFGEGNGFREAMLGFAIHMIPTALFVVLLVLAWHWEWIGATAFLALGAYYLVSTWGRMHWAAYATISGPLFLLSVLFLLNWLQRSRLDRTGTDPDHRSHRLDT